MKPKEVLRTIEYHLELKPTKMPKIKEDPKYLQKKGVGAEILLVKKGKKITGRVITIENKQDTVAIAEELTHLIDFKHRVFKKTKTYENYFYDNVLMEALGYYGSKIIDSKRKPDLIPELQDYINNKLYPERKFDVLLELQGYINNKCWGKLKTYHTFDRNPEVDKLLWHQIGYDLGERLYEYVQKTGNKNLVKELFIKNRNKEKPFGVYKRILKQIQNECL